MANRKTKEFDHGKKRHSVDAWCTDLGSHSPQHFRYSLSDEHTFKDRRGARVTESTRVSAALVSDYVAGRLEDATARRIELAALRDRSLSKAIEDARAVRRRVKERLAGPRQ